MARLEDLLPELKDDTLSQSKLSEVSSVNITGKKRRAWLVESADEKEMSKSKGSMNRIDKHDSLPPIKSVLENTKKQITKMYSPQSLCFRDLRSNPLQLFHFLYTLMQKENDDYKTPRVRLRDMMLNINISKDSARTALRFLLKQNFIERIEFQPGQLGWSKYRLNKEICNELNAEISKGRKSPFELVSDKSVLKQNTPNIDSDPWDIIDVSALEYIGFTNKHLLQIKNKTTLEIAQESINHFAYALKHNKKTSEYKNPIATLISVLKRGEAWIEPNYQSPQEIAQLQIIEAKKAELQRKKDIEEQIFKIAFDEWLQELSQEDISTLAPDLRKKGDPTPPNAKLSLYFKENIWPERKSNFSC